MRTLLVSLVLALTACASHTPAQAPLEQHAPQHGHPHGGSAQHRFEDAEQWAQRFEDPARDAWQKPDEVIAALDVPPGGKVADIGAATGYFPVRIARAHPDATVYGVDIEPDMVRYLAERARHEGLTNVHAVQAEPADPKLPEAVDRVLLVDTYHHVEARPAYFKRLQGALRPGGRLVVVDFKLDSELGPRREHKLAPEQVVRELSEAGYRKVGERTLPEQYVLVFERG